MEIAKKHYTRRQIRAAIGKYTILIVLTVILILPFAVLFFTSFKSSQQIIEAPLSLLPWEWHFENYARAFSQLNFFLLTFNSLHIVFFSIIGTLLSSSLVAYAFVNFKVRETPIIFSVMLSSIMIPAQVVQIPMYELYRSFEWINTFIPFWIPPFLGGGIANVFLIMQFMRSVPAALSEAAEIDGASSFRVFWQIIIPLCKPILFTVGIFTFIGCWNDFFSPLLYLTNEENFTLALGLYHVYNSNINGSKPWNLVSAANIVTMIPIILIYFFMQRYFVEGITLGSVKG